MQVGYNLSDLGITCLGYTAERATIIDYAGPLMEVGMHWVSNAPGKLSHATNILTIFDKTSWLLIFVSMVLVRLVLIAAYLVAHHFGSKKPDITLLLLEPLETMNAEALPVDDRTKKQTRKGCTQSFIFLFWSVIGTLLVLLFLCNYRTMMLKPTMGKPIDTTKDLVLSGNTPIIVAGIWVDILESSTNEWHRKAAQMGLLIPSPTLIKQNLKTLVQAEGTHSLMIIPSELAYILKDQENSRAVHFSKESIMPYFTGMALTKLSPWKKIIDHHILLIHEVDTFAFHTVNALFIGWIISKTEIESLPKPQNRRKR